MNEPLEIQPVIRTAPSIIPVLDLMIGQIVLARGGHRDQYTPIHTKLTTCSDPLVVARAMFGQTGCDCLYLADLDSHEGARPNQKVYKELLQAGFRIWADADWLTHERLDVLSEEFSELPLRPILSTEAISDVEQLEWLGEYIEFDPIFGIDVKGESILTKSETFRRQTPVELAKRVVDHGIQTLIYLNLEVVGTDQGVVQTAEVVNQIHGALPTLNLISGGGVRSVEDAAELMQAGCQHVLVASAIHDCKFRPDDVTMLNERRCKLN